MLSGIGWLLVAIWAVATGVPSLWFIGRSLRRQSDRVPEPEQWPFLSIVVPARDEGHKIEAGLRSLWQSDYPNFEIIALNDRSRDQTGAIMDSLAAEAAASASPEGIQRTLRVIHITELPDDWLGKNHALQTGSQQSRGEWVLFTDGDVIYKPDTLRRAVRYAVARNLDHLPLFPNIEAHSFVEAAFVACFALSFMGAFNLVRRSALELAGGFQAIRLDIRDDVKLGKLLKRMGSRGEVLRAGDGLNIRWQQSAWACITGLEKNAFAAANYSLFGLLWIVSVTAFLFLGPLLGSLFAGDARTGFVVALVLSHLIYGFNSYLFGHSFWLFPLMIPASLAFLFAFVRSTWITLRQGGVRWRDTFYPLELLRKHVYY
jgi:glycosyltransferase involved in cell wall biosynthesis